jgi:hypothetical protein
LYYGVKATDIVRERTESVITLHRPHH